MIIRKGSKSRLLLPDGTTVILNADSKISYSKTLAKVNSLLLKSKKRYTVYHYTKSFHK